MLAAAIWHNVLYSTNVNADSGITALDALTVINELNNREYSDPETASLDTELPDPQRPPYYDVNCDGTVTALDALLVINTLNDLDFNPGFEFGATTLESVEGTAGSYEAFACHVKLTEGKSLRTELTSRVVLPAEDSGVRLRFETPMFDKSSTQSMQDSFEVTVTDLDGTRLTQPYAFGRTAAFNWSEDEGSASGVATAQTSEEVSSGTVHDVVINLAHLAAGTEVIVTARLVNNDGDDVSSIVVHDVKPVAGLEQPPLVFAGEPGDAISDQQPIVLEDLEDVSSSMQAGYGRTSYTSDRTQVISDLVVTNRGSQAVTGQMIVVLDQFSDAETFVMHPDGLLPDGRPYFNLTGYTDGALEAGASTRPREIRFTNPSEQRFNYRLTTLGDLNMAPRSFDTTPDGQIEAGRTYRYAATAIDEDAQTLSYQVVSGPSSLAIDANSGQVNWNTGAGDIGRHAVVIRATDPFGLFVEQRFTIDVLESLQNRPPNFISDPVTDATASSGFEITTVGVGASPNGVSTISGFRGPRLVSINAGDQTVGVYAGQSNDRFDDVTTYSTGEPKPTDAIFQSGYSVGVGLPPFLREGDTNNVLGMDQGDFNGDGVLDLVAITAEDPAGAIRPTYVFAVMLGDGDGNFGDPQVIPIAANATASYKHLRVADLNSDGSLDVIVIDETSGSASTILGNGDGTFGVTAVQMLSVSMNDYRLADINQDGVLDLYGRNFNKSALGWMPGVGDGTFSDFIQVSGEDSNTNANQSYLTKPYQAVDLDGDGDLDFVIGKRTGSLIELWTNDGSENFALAGTLTGLRNASTQLQGVTDLRVADFTGDGYLDIFYSGTDRSGYSMYIGSSTPLAFTYQDASDSVGTYAGEANPAGNDAPLDIDGDGDLDLVMGNGHAGEKYAARVLINDGTGFFTSTDYASVDFVGQETEISQTNDNTVAGVLAGDYNRDGIVDLSYYTRGGDDFNGVGIILGTRPGEFYGSHTIDFPKDYEALAADFDGDGIVDLLSIESASMLLGNGDGTFQPGFPAVSVGSPAGDAQIVDFNQDGILDFIASRSEGFYVAMGNGDGTFEVSFNVNIPGSFYGYSHISNGDFNNDGLPDIIGRAGVEKFIEVWLNQADNPGTFVSAFRESILGSGTLTRGFQHAVAEGDFNEDGFLDFAAGSLLETNNALNSLKIFSGAGDGTFTLTHEQADYNDAFFGDFYHPGELASGDVNEDGHLDIVSFTTGGPVVHLGVGDGTFQFLDQYFQDASDISSKDSYLVDMDQDGHLDMVQVVFTDSVNVRRGLGDGTFQDPIRIDSIGRTNPASFADLDHDGHLDLVFARKNSNGGASYGAADLYFGVRDGLVDMLTVDLNGDGNEEILAINEANDRLKLFVGDNLGGLTRQPDLLTGRAPKAVAVADLDGDGRLELITANRAGRSLSVFSGSVATGYTPIDFPLRNGAIDIAAADLDGDGSPDLVALDDTDNALWIYTGNGTTILATPVALALGDVASKLTLADATGDGLIDAIITLTETNRLMILPNRGLGFQPEIFGAPIYLTLSSSPSDVQAVDLNDDGHIDLVATLPNENVVSVLFGRGGNQFARPQQIVVGVEPTRIVLADADEDGRTDLIVTNSGDNTASVIYNRFDPNEVYRYDSDAIDPDDDPVTYSIVDGPGGLIINSQTGELLWAASPDQVGEHSVTLSANDGRGGIATQSFKIQVEPARENASPLIATVPDTKIGAADTFTYQATAIDIDRDTIRYRLIDAPAGATIDPITGLIEWDARTDLAISTVSRSDGRIDISPNTQLQSPTFTSEGWFYFDGLPPSNGLANFFVQSGTYSLGNRGNFALRLDLIHPNAGLKSVDIPFVTKADRWYHFALVVDDTARTVGVYVDGQEVYSAAIIESLAFDPEQNSQIGSNNTYGFVGIIDNFRHWTVARTANEIQEGLGRQYDGDTRLVIDYRFDNINSFSVRDYSPAGNTGFRIINSAYPELAPGLANTGFHSFTIGAEDGRGGFDTQSFDLEIAAELRGSIVGHLFNDFNGDGNQNDGSGGVIPAEPSLGGWQLYIDTNANGYPDPSESSAITDVDGNYRFAGLLPGNYPLRISAVAGYVTPAGRDVAVSASAETVVDLAIEQLSLSHIRGQLRTEEDSRIAYWNVYADLDENGQRDAGEPMAMSDASGDYALTGLAAGAYTIRPELPAGWVDTAGRDGLSITLATDEILADNNFVLAPSNTSVTAGVHFVTTPPNTIEARQTFRYASIAKSISATEISYDLSLAPDGMTIDPATGLVAWRPSIDQVGEHTVILRATTASGSIALHDFTIDVTAPNTLPLVTSVPPSFAYVGLAYVYDVIAQDAESPSIKFSLETAPVGAAIDESSGQLVWRPTAADIGDVNFKVAVVDQDGGTTFAVWTVNVQLSTPTALPIVIDLPRNTSVVNQSYLGNISGTDALGRTVSWSLTNGPSGLTIQSGGTLSWTPTIAQLGERTIELSAITADDVSHAVTLIINVTGSEVNSSPSIQSVPIASAVVGQQYRYDVAVVDADRDRLSYSLLAAPIGMSIHPLQGAVIWTPAADQLGETNVTIEVSDRAGKTALQTFRLTATRFGGPPRFESIPPTEAAVGIAYLYTARARDAEGDPLVHTLLAAPSGMSINEVTGEISWTPTVDQVGRRDVVIQIADGVGGAVTQAFAIRVANGVPNLAPTILSESPRFGAVGTEYRYTLAASDPESTPLVYSLRRGPDGMSVDGATGEVAWTPSVDQVGKHIVTLVATDAGGAAAIESFEFDVLAENQAPAISGIPPVDVAAGAMLRYDVLASDADLDRLTFELTTAPEGASIDTFGRITWATSVALIGSHDFVVKVSDPRGGETTQAFTLSVIEDLIAPKLSLIENLGDANRNILPWQGPFKVFVRAIDNVAIASLTLQANGRDIPLDAAGTATFTFEEWAFATITATATAIDTNGNVTQKTISFDYDFPEGWSGAGTQDIPTAIITSPADTAAVTGMVSIVGTAEHADFAAYKLSYRHVDETSFTEFFESTTPVANGELGVWDTSLLLNDEYVIRLEVATNAGVVNVVEHHVGLAGELKLGNFRLSFTDMVIPVAGIPIEITRIYDTLQADREGDFGYGWRLEYRNTDLRVGLPKSGLEDIGIYSALRQGVKVYLNVPGQGRQGFTFNPDIRVLPGWGGNNLVLARPRFTPDPGVTSTLATGTSSYLQVNEFGELHAPGGIPYNPASPDFGGAYVLSTREGITYRIDGATGELNSATDRNGNKLNFSEAGIVYGDESLSIQFVHDAAGRITRITDPDGNTFKYDYSTNGNLVCVTDGEGNATKLTYSVERSHFLENVIDPLGRTGARTDYDAQGRLVRIFDAQGNQITMASDPDNLVESITDAKGNKLTVEYDSRGNIVSQVDARGAVTRRTFDNNNNLTSETDPLGNTTNYTFDARGNTTSITDPLGHSRTFTYALNGRILKAADEIGAVTENNLDSKGNVLSTTDPLGNVTTNAYDGRGNQLSETDALGHVTRYAYDSYGNLVSKIDALGRLTQYANDRRGNRLSESTSMTTSSGVVTVTTTWTYDGNGREISRRDALGNMSKAEYNSLGKKTATIDANGNRTEYSYDERGLLLTTRFADETTTSSTYDTNGRRASSTDQLGRLTHFEYDSVGNLTATIFPDATPDTLADNPRTRTEYDSTSRIVARIDETGNRTEFRLDNLGRSVATILPDDTPNDLQDNLRTERFLDARGLNVRLDDPINGSVTYFYDLKRNLASTTFTDGTRIRQEFDTLGKPISEIDQNGIPTRFQYDELGRLIAVAQTSNTQNDSDPKTFYGYDELGNLTTQTDANGNTTRYHYDVSSRRIGTTMPLGQSSSTVYDAMGNVLSETNFNGERIDRTYDTLNRLERRELPDGSSFAFTYTATGFRNTIVDERGVTTYTYDARDRVLSRTEPDGVAIRYEYDLAGNEIAQTTLAGTVYKTFNPLRQLSTVTDTQGGVTSYGYDSRGRLVQTQYPNGTTDFLALDDLSRILRIETQGPSGLIRSMDYTLDATGRRVGTSEASGRVVAYGYDSLYRLLAERITDPTLGNRTIEYQYDLVGNRMLKLDSAEGRTSYAYDDNDRLLEEAVAGVKTTYTYDANGNTLTKFTSANDQTTYRWNAENRLLSATVVEAGNSSQTSYKYDGEGLRVESTVKGTISRMLLDKNVQHAQVVVEYTNSEHVQVAYSRGLQLISAIRGTEQAHYHADAIGTVGVLTGADGTILDSYVYDAFGNTLEQSIAFENRFLFAGEYRDASLGWDFLRARYYGPSEGRFSSRDSFDGYQNVPMSLNRYGYVHADPLNAVDPSGNDAEWSLIALSINVTIYGTLFVALGSAAKKSDSADIVWYGIAGVGYGAGATAAVAGTAFAPAALLVLPIWYFWISSYDY